MAKYRYKVERKSNGSMTQQNIQEFVDVELSVIESKLIKADDRKYTKNSALVSSKLGYPVIVLQFPELIKENIKQDKEGQTTDTSRKSNKSFWKPIWAIPFKLIWRLIKLVLPF